MEYLYSAFSRYLLRGAFCADLYHITSHVNVTNENVCLID